MYLVVSKDTHCDDSYYPFLSREKALLKAKELVGEAMAHYKDDRPRYSQPYGNTIFSVADMSGTWKVQVLDLVACDTDITVLLEDLTDIQAWHEDYHSRSYCVFCNKIDNNMCEHHDHCAYARAKALLRDMP